MKPGLTLVFLVMLASISGAQVPASKEATKCAVQGKVIQEPGEQPLKKTNIQLIGHSQDGRCPLPTRAFPNTGPSQVYLADLLTEELTRPAADRLRQIRFRSLL